MKMRVIQIGVVFVAILGVLVFRMNYESKKEYYLGEKAHRAGKVEEAISHFDRALHWYYPGNPHIEVAAQGLWKIGQSVEGPNRKIALMAYDALRGGILSTRSFYVPHRTWLEKANGRIARLRAEEEVESNKKADIAKTVEYHQKLLAHEEQPNLFWSLVVTLGFLGWAGSVAGFIWRGFDREGRMLLRPSLPWIASTTLCFGAWIAGLLYA